MRFFSIFFKYYKKLTKKSYSTLSGSIAFFLIINGGSIAYLIMLIANLFDFELVIDNPSINVFLKGIESRIDYSNKFFTIFFIITSIYGASSLFFHLLKTGEIIYEEMNDKFTIIRRLTAIIFLTTTLFIIELFFILLVLGNNVFPNYFWHVIKYIILLFIPYVISICINFFVTPHAVKFKEINKGACFTTVFWYVVTIGFTIYLKVFTNYKAIYGALTFFIVFMIWIYLLAQGLIIGIILNYYEKEKNVRLLRSMDVNTNIGTPKEDNETI